MKGIQGSKEGWSRRNK